MLYKNCSKRLKLEGGKKNMKKIYKILTFALAMTLTFVLAGCGKNPDPPTDTPLTTIQVASLMKELVNLNDFNFTATVGASYEFSKKEGTNLRQAQSDVFENIVLKMDGANAYINIPNMMESYQFDNWVFERDFGEGYEIDYDNDSRNVFEMFMEQSSDIETIISETLGNLVNFDSSWVNSEKLANGGYKLSLNADLKADLISLQTALTTYGDSNLEDLFDAMLQIHYGEEFNLATLIDSLKTEITTTSTLEDLFDFVKEELGFDVKGYFAASRNFILAMDEDAEIPELTDNFFTLIEIDSNEDFATMIDSFVTEFLQNEDITLNAFLESDNFFAEMLSEMYDAFMSITINELNFDFELVTNAEKTQIHSIAASVNADISTTEMNITLDADASIVFSNFGSTQVALPTLAMEDVEEIDLYYDFEGDGLVLNTAKVIENVHLGSLTFEFTTYANVPSATLVYDPINHTLTLSAEAVNYLLNDNSYLSFFNQDNPGYVGFSYYQVD